MHKGPLMQFIHFKAISVKILNKLSRIFLFSMLVLLFAPLVQARPIELSSEEMRLTGSTTPLMDRRIGRVTFEDRAKCRGCGNQDAMLARTSGPFMNELKKQLRNNGVLSPEAERRLSLRVVLTDASYQFTQGNTKFSGELSISMTLSYILSDGDQEILNEPITTQATSKSAPVYRETDALDETLRKNLRLFLLSFKAALEPEFVATAEREIRAITNENYDTRSLTGRFFSGLASTGKGVAKVSGSVLGGALKVVGSKGFAEGVNSAAQNIAAQQRQQAQQMASLQAQMRKDQEVLRQAKVQQNSQQRAREAVSVAAVKAPQAEAVVQPKQPAPAPRVEAVAQQKQPAPAQQSTEKAPRQTEQKKTYKNPGESAMQCVDISKNKDGRTVFKNICSEQIFVLYCGELTSSKGRCGDGPKGGYYTHSKILEPGYIDP